MLSNKLFLRSMILTPFALSVAACSGNFDFSVEPPQGDTGSTVITVEDEGWFGGPDVRAPRMVGSVETVTLKPTRPLGSVVALSSNSDVADVKEMPSTASVCCSESAGAWQCVGAGPRCDGVLEPVRRVEIVAKAPGQARVKLVDEAGHEVDGAALAVERAASSDLAFRDGQATTGDAVTLYANTMHRYVVGFYSEKGVLLRAPGVVAVTTADPSVIGFVGNGLFPGDTKATGETQGKLDASKPGRTTITTSLGRVYTVDVVPR